MASVRVNSQYRPRHCFECWLPCMSRSAQKSKQGRKKRGPDPWSWSLEEFRSRWRRRPPALWRVETLKDAMVSPERSKMDAARWVCLHSPAFLSFFGDSNWCMTRGCLVGDHHPWNAAQLKGEKCKQLPENIWWVWVGIPLPGKHGCA